MTDVFTVLMTATWEGEGESIPWQLSFADLDLAKGHVLEEAARHAVDWPDTPAGVWEDYEDYSTFTQTYNEEVNDRWLVVRTELVEQAPSGQMSSM